MVVAAGHRSRPRQTGASNRATNVSEHNNPQRTNPPKPKRSTQSKLWITASLVLSIIVLGWTFSLPFRALPNAGDDDKPALAERLQQKRSRAEQLRDEAFANHQEFLRTVSIQKAATQGNKPGRAESLAHWRDRKSQIAEQLKELEQEAAIKGTLQWHAQRMLRESLQDGPE